MFIVFVWFGVINGSIKLNQALTSFLTTINQPQWPWEWGSPQPSWEMPVIHGMKEEMMWGGILQGDLQHRHMITG